MKRFIFCLLLTLYPAIITSPPRPPPSLGQALRHTEMIVQHTNRDDYDTTHEHTDDTRKLTSTDKVVYSLKEKLIRRGHDKLFAYKGL